MLKLIRRLLFVGILGLAALVAYGYLTGRPWRPGDPLFSRDGGPIDAEAARAKGAEVVGRAAEAAGQLEERLGEGALTAKIKAKMALDDVVKASAIDVDTAPGGIVTLSGVVSSEAERERAVRIAKETSGVTKVVDELRLK